MKRAIVGLAAAALVLAACTGGEVVSDPSQPEVGLEQIFPEDKLVATDPCYTGKAISVAGLSAGSLIAAHQLNDSWASDVNGVAYRVLYTSIMADEKDIVPVCGTVLFPSNGFSGKVVNWAHGTVGLTKACVPFRTPAGMNNTMKAGGLGAPTKDDTYNGLVDMLGSGYAVFATDYYSGMTGRFQPYAAGIAEGAQVLDLLRAVRPQGAQYAVWGHSQGGGSSLWAGQIASEYLPSSYELKAVAAAAPASQFVPSKGQPSEWDGFHLGDRDMYNYVYDILPIGDVLFSYVMQSWAPLSEAKATGRWASLPPTKLKLEDVLTGEAIKASGSIASGACISQLTDPKTLASLTALKPFTLNNKNPVTGRFEAKPFFSKPFQGIFLEQTPGFSRPGIDNSCVNDTKFGYRSVAGWCEALRWNMPGLSGTNPNVAKTFDAPLLLTQGTSDNVVWCFSKGSINPPAIDCLAKQYQLMNQDAMNITAKYYANADHFGVMPASGQETIAFIKGAL